MKRLIQVMLMEVFSGLMGLVVLLSNSSLALGQPVPGGPGFVSLSGIAFKPYSTTSTYAFNGQSLYNPGASATTYESPVSLPHGATVTNFVVYFIDNDVAQDLTAHINVCPLDAVFCSYMATTTTSGSSALTRNVTNSTITNGKIDLQSNSYLVEVFIPPGTSTSLALFGVRIDYGFGLNLPLIIK